MSNLLDLADFIWPDAAMGRQPQGAGYAVDLDNKFGKRLAHLIVPIDGAMVDLVGGGPFTPVAGPTSAVTPAGKALKTVAGSSQYGYFATRVSNWPYTILTVHVVDSTAAGAHVALNDSTGVGRAILFYGSAAGSYTASCVPNSGGSDGVLAASNGVVNVAGLRVNSSGLSSVFANGAISSGTYTVSAQSMTRLYISARLSNSSGIGVYASQRNSLVLVFPSALSDAEIAELCANPLQVIGSQTPIPFATGGGPVTYNLAMSESASMADVSTLALTAALSLTESGTAGDALSAAMLASLAIAEAAAGSDTQTAALGAPVSISEAGSSSDSQSSAATMPQTVAESGVATDAVTAAMSAALTVSEAGSASDFQTTAATFSLNTAEAAAATDAQSLAATMPLSVSEAAFAVDAQTAGATMAATVAEAATAADLVSQGAVYLVSVSESASAADAQTIFNGISLNVSEAMTASDLASQLTTIYAAVVEAGFAVDSTSCFNPSSLHQSFRRTAILGGRTFVVATPSRVLAVIKPANTTVAPYDPSETGP